MTKEHRTANGGFLLRPGRYELNAQSYCLHAGTHGPADGEGYLYAPLKGSQAEILRHILQHSAQHPEFSQGQIQTLIWAIQSRAQFSKMSSQLQTVARQLLTEDEINHLNGNALDQIPETIQRRVLSRLPPALQQVFKAETTLRQRLTQGNASFEELTRVAVLTGHPGQGEGSRTIPKGRWSWHPSGLFVRYLPSGFSRTRIQTYVPERYTVERDTLGRITAIADAQGNRIETEYDDTISPQPSPNNPTLVAYAFRTIRLIRPNPARTGGREQVELRNKGWTFVDRPFVSVLSPSHPSATRTLGIWLAWVPHNAAQQPLLAQRPDSFDDWLARLEKAKEWKEKYSAPI